jgi:uncharacterized protein YhaN
VKNEGIIQHGGAMNVGNMAVGRGASATQYQNAASDAALEAVRVQMDKVIELLAAKSHEIPDHEEVVQSAQSLKQELGKDKPNKLTMKSLLAGIADSVTSVASVATAVEALRTAMSALFG